jgi:hypothetical protein
VLVIGWLFGLPVPFIVMWAPSWEWVVAANALLPQTTALDEKILDFRVFTSRVDRT